jgi:hypothetical protein
MVGSHYVLGSAAISVYYNLENSPLYRTTHLREEMARRDKRRYEVEKTMYTGPWKVPANKSRCQKDPK